MTPISSGEFARWRDDDREWKSEAMKLLIDQGERLTALEVIAEQVTRAESAATGTKRWAVVGGTVAAIINGFLLVFGGSAK